MGREIYEAHDFKSLMDWTLTREFRRIPRIAGVVSSGLEVKRYEIQPDPDRLKEYGITLDQLETAISSSNANVGGNYVIQGPTIEIVRGIGLIGGGEEDPITIAMAASTPHEAAKDSSRRGAPSHPGNPQNLSSQPRIVCRSVSNTSSMEAPCVPAILSESVA